MLACEGSIVRLTPKELGIAFDVFFYLNIFPRTGVILN